ncbi:type I-F CRISPR-associated endoribonuclease Cas6/Csy4 [Psychrobacter sp. I-STPA6b]|uniref:type I-F CRISPR-associated endoribonuclease Cas6/Csy4 n=1 Tax=Psychrobacter sp. I-STPA6b TaxID=2585718 RepID=UPI001D0CA900|nr:type I-F CRISPR-associated endoribonuclease Cas6/Csy4 [Psychrobacter sp. I-STPA6b]
MTHYQELTLIDSAEKSLYEIWSHIYTQLHIALADIKNKHGIKTIGVSFPNYRYEEKCNKTFALLGNKLRVFAPSQADLEKLDLNRWLSRLTDYVHIKSIKEVPKTADQYLLVRRYRFTPLDKRVQSLATHHNVSFDDAMAQYTSREKRAVEKHYPYISLKSESNDKRPYPLRIWQQSAEKPQQGQFNAYGMNNMTSTVTVPHWQD